MDSEEVDEKDSEIANSSRSNSLTLHPDKVVANTQAAAAITQKSYLFSHQIKDLKARLMKIMSDEAEATAEINVTFTFVGYIVCKRMLPIPISHIFRTSMPSR